MKIAIVVHGRFHAFDLARELIRLGHEVLLLTNYPRRWPENFGVPAGNVRSLVAHGIVSRAALALGKAAGNEKFSEAFLHRWFGKWAARQLAQRKADFTHLFSGVALETLVMRKEAGMNHSVMRGSCHIRTQRKILDDEERRAGRGIEKPSDWMIQREEREYGEADLVVCLSRFAYDSFCAEGFPQEKLSLNPLGVEHKIFSATKSVLDARRQRIMTARLRVLGAGNLSLQKGAMDYLVITEKMKHRIDFIHRGAVSPDAKKIQSQLDQAVQILPKVEQRKLPQDYFGADLFLFPTLQDGFAAVLAQASAAGLPILATTNCAARDFLTEGKDAWIFPIRRPDLIVQRLEWCDQNRQSLASVAEQAGKPKPEMEWREQAGKLVEAFERFMRKKKK